MTTPLPGDIFKVGQVLNNTYIIDKILGRGGTGEVYRARNKITERLVAVKALNRQFSGNADYIELMKREEEMRAIQHPAVVRYTECSMSDDDHVFLVMDYVEGQPLSDVMTNRRMDPRELLIIGHSVAEGLVATHAKGIIHRDLSPDNIILRDGEPANATIIDFGIAKDTAVGARTIVGSEFAGKYEYSAPEQLEGHVDPQSDLYALGATLLAAFRGETPFMGATPGEIVRRKQAPLDTDGVPEPLRQIIETLTAPDPKQRPADAAALAVQINGLLRPTQNGASGADHPKKSGRLPFVIAGIAVAGLAAAWVSGVFDRFVTPPIPHADPYVLSFSFDADAAPVLTGNAPTAEAASRLQDAALQGFGMQPSGDLILATGLPDGTWEAETRDLIQQMARLESGRLAVSNRMATITGLATDTTAKSVMLDAIDQFAVSNKWQITSDLIAGPLSLTAQTLNDALQTIEECGPLTVSGATDGAFGVTDPITVTGNLASAATETSIANLLEPIAGERPVAIATQTLNPQLCEIRQALVAIPTNIVTLTLTDGATGARNLSGVFTTGQNPVVDVLVPQQYGENALWVMAVNPDGSVFHVVPNNYNEDTQVSQLSARNEGIYRVRALHTEAEFASDNTKIAIRISDEDYEKSEIIAILSRAPLFAVRRPTSESVSSTALALTEILSQNPDNILGVASVIIDARP